MQQIAALYSTVEECDTRDEDMENCSWLQK